MHFDSSARQFRLRRPGGVDTRHQWRCRLVVRPIWALALSPILGSRPGPQRGWAEPLPGRSDPAVPAAGRLIRGGGLCASVDQSAELTQAERGHRRGFLDPASSQQRQHHRAMLHCWRCRLAGAGTGGSGANHRQVSPGSRVLAADAATSRASMGPMDDNQAPSRCRLVRRFAHERDEMDRQTARITGEQCARRLQMCGWTLGSVDAATSGML